MLEIKHNTDSRGECQMMYYISFNKMKAAG